MFLARVLPVVAMLAVCILYFTDLQTQLHYTLFAISIGFAFVSVAWWWWVMFAMKDLHNNIILSQEKFHHIITEIADIKKTLKETKEQ